MRGARRTDLDGLDEALQLARTLAPALFREVMQTSGARFLCLHQSGKVPQIDRLIESYAWTDAAFALIGFAIPKWSIRRIIRADVEWYCSLSQQPNLPIEAGRCARSQPRSIAACNVESFHCGAPQGRFSAASCFSGAADTIGTSLCILLRQLRLTFQFNRTAEHANLELPHKQLAGQILDGDQFGAVELAEQSDAGIDRLVDQSAVALAHDHDSAGAAIAFRAAFLGADRPLLQAQPVEQVVRGENSPIRTPRPRR